MTDIGKQHQLKIARSVLRMSEVGAMIAGGGMTHRDAYSLLFFTAYHDGKKPFRAMKNFLSKYFKDHPSKHLKALHHFLDTAGLDSDGDETPGMIYGMITDAWDKFISEVEAAGWDNLEAPDG